MRNFAIYSACTDLASLIYIYTYIKAKRILHLLAVPRNQFSLLMCQSTVPIIIFSSTRYTISTLAICTICENTVAFFYGTFQNIVF
jgi:hypothetical protein